MEYTIIKPEQLNVQGLTPIHEMVSANRARVVKGKLMLNQHAYLELDKNIKLSLNFASHQISDDEMENAAWLTFVVCGSGSAYLFNDPEEVLIRYNDLVRIVKQGTMQKKSADNILFDLAFFSEYGYEKDPCPEGKEHAIAYAKHIVADAHYLEN